MPTAAADMEMQVLQVDLEVGRRLQWRRESMRVKVPGREMLHHETSSIYLTLDPMGCDGDWWYFSVVVIKKRQERERRILRYREE